MIRKLRDIVSGTRSSDTNSEVAAAGELFSERMDERVQEEREKEPPESEQ